MRKNCYLLVVAVLMLQCATPNRLMKKADDAIANDKYNDAVVILKDILKKKPDHSEALLKLGTCYGILGNIDNATHYFSIMLDKDSSYINQATVAYWQAAQANSKIKRIDLTLRSLKAILELDPSFDFKELTFLLADSLFESRDYRRAMQVYLKEVQRDSLNPSTNRPWALYQLGLCQENLGELDNAIQTFRIFIEDYPRNPILDKALFHQSQCAYQLAEKVIESGRLGEALELTKLVIRNGLPTNIQDKAWFLQGEILMQLGDLAAAEIAYLKVLDLNPYRTGKLVERASQRIREVRR